MLGLLENQRCIVSLPGCGTARGVILEVFVKSYLVRLDGGARERFSAAKVKPESSRKPTAKLEPLTPGLTSWDSVIIGGEALPLRPIPKPEPPELCLAWLAFVRRQPCCNCDTSSSIEAHHEGKKGVSQKVRDTMAVGLCAPCHRVYTDKNRLPNPYAATLDSDIGLRTREESLEILRNEQERLLQAALQLLEPRESRVRTRWPR